MKVAYISFEMRTTWSMSSIFRGVQANVRLAPHLAADALAGEGRRQHGPLSWRVTTRPGSTLLLVTCIVHSVPLEAVGDGAATG